MRFGSLDGDYQQISRADYDWPRTERGRGLLADGVAY